MLGAPRPLVCEILSKEVNKARGSCRRIHGYMSILHLFGIKLYETDEVILIFSGFFKKHFNKTFLIV